MEELINQSLVSAYGKVDKTLSFNKNLEVSDLILCFQKNVLTIHVSLEDELEVYISELSKGMRVDLKDFPEYTNVLSDYRGKKLFTYWLPKNAQGYEDVILFGFNKLQPTLCLVAEGGLIKVKEVVAY